MVALLNLVRSCGYLALLQMANGQPFRGGIDVGVGAEVSRRGGEVDIYGPALVRAYELESKTARYPRIAVGQGLPQTLSAVLAHEEDHTVSEIQKNAAGAIQEMLFQAPDGVLMLDFLGKAFKTRGAGSMDGQTVRKAHDFVAAQTQRWSADTSKEGLKLYGRYRELATYFERRMYLWS